MELVVEDDDGVVMRTVVDDFFVVFDSFAGGLSLSAMIFSVDEQIGFVSSRFCSIIGEKS